VRGPAARLIVVSEHPRKADLLRAARRFIAAGYVIRRVDEQGVHLVKRDLHNPLMFLILGWFYLLTRIGRKDRRILLTTNSEGRLVVRGAGRAGSDH
jgi:hypothetical protein